MARSLLRDRDVRELALAPLEELQAAVALLTRVPVGPSLIRRSGASAFGLVGAAIGVAGALPLLLLGEPLPWAAAVLAIAVVAVLSGALHLDGLSDTADALVAFGPVAAERARKDPAAGPAGIVALVLVLALQVASLAAVLGTAGPVVAGAMLVVAASAGRSIAMLVAWTRRSAPRSADGAGERFAERTTGVAAVATVATSVAVAGIATALGGPVVSVAALLGGALSLALGALVVRWRRGVDGDALGAVIELTVTTTVLVAAIAAGR